jgi:hypothetical protein
MTASVQLKKNICRDSQGACRQDKLIGGKAPVVKKLGLWPSSKSPVKRRLGGWCEMAASLGVSRLTGSYVREAVKIEAERVKLKNLHC